MDLKNNQLNEEETALLNAMPWLNEDKVEQTAMKQLMNGQHILGVADSTGLSQAEQQARTMAGKWLHQLGVSYDAAVAHRLGVLPSWTDPAHNDGASEPAMLLPTGEHVVKASDGTAVPVNDGYVAYGLQTGRRCAVSPRSKRAYLFGSPNLEAEGGHVFVVRSELDALAIMARGLKAITVFDERDGERLVRELSERRRKLGRAIIPCCCWRLATTKRSIGKAFGCSRNFARRRLRVMRHRNCWKTRTGKSIRVSRRWPRIRSVSRY